MICVIVPLLSCAQILARSGHFCIDGTFTYVVRQLCKAALLLGTSRHAENKGMAHIQVADAKSVALKGIACGLKAVRALECSRIGAIIHSNQRLECRQGKV